MKSFLFSIILVLSFYSFGQMPIPFTPASDGMTFNTCFGFIIDSGGQGGPGYSNNESSVITLCPDTPGEIISIQFNLFALNTTNTGTAQNPNLDYVAVYDGIDVNANSLGVYTGNQLQGVVIEATQLNPTGCITLQFYSNASGTGMFTASVNCETPCADPQAGGEIIGGITSDSIRVCVGDIVSFQDAGSFAQTGFTLIDYSWDFMDGTTGNGQSVQHSWSVPGFYRVQLFVTDDNGCSNPNLIDLKVMVGTIPDFTGFPGDQSICLGESMTFAADPESYEVEWTGFPGSLSIDDGCLPDTLLGVSQDIQLLQTGFSAGTTIANVNDIQSVCLEMEHSFMGDLVIIIECPNGQNSILHQQGGGGTQIGIPVQADNVDCADPTTIGIPFTYCFTPTATETWVDWVTTNGGGTLPAGNYASIDPLSNLVGCPTNGVWTLTVIDNWAADDGTLFSFGLTLDPSYYPPVPTFEPQIGLASDSSYWSNAQFLTSITNDFDTITVTPTQSGSFIYEYFVIDNFGCTYDTSVVLTVDPLADVYAGADTSICNGASFQLNPNLVNVATSCNYVLTMEDSFGDTWNGNTLTVTVNGVSTDYTCSNPSVQVVNLSIPAGANVTVTFNANGGFVNECSYFIEDDQGNTVINQPTLFGVQTNNFTSNCVPDYDFEWTPTLAVDNATIADPNFIGTTTQMLTVVTYPVGHPLCASTDSILVTLSATPYPGADATVDFCSSSAPEDLFPYLGPGAFQNGQWLDPLNNPVTMPFDPASMPFGNYTYVADSNGCSDQAVITVNELITQINSVTTVDVSCNGGSDGSMTVTGTNIDAYSYSGGNVVSGSPFTINGLSAGVYTITVFSNQGCSATQDVTINEPTVLTAASVVVAASCFGVCDGEVQITPNGGTAGYSYTWPQGVQGSQNGMGTGICAGPYDATVTDANGCTVLVPFVITEPANVTPSFQGDVLSGCSPHTVNFVNTTAGNSILTTVVDFGDGSTQTVNGLQAFDHTYEIPGAYDVSITITTNDGCVYSISYTDYISVYENPNANFTISPNNISSLEGQTSLLNSSSNDVTNWNWVIPDGNPATSSNENVTPIQFPIGTEATYPVTLYVTTANGCVDSITYFVTVVSEVLLFAPNTFTPDGDEFNQTWEIFISGIDVYDFELRLYNRWGETVWESHDPSVGWDGTYANSGRIVQDGTYTWTITCADQFNDEKYTFNGHVTVIK